MLLAHLGAERAGIAGATLVYGLQYYAGVRAHFDTRRNLLRSLGKYLNGCEGEGLGFMMQWGKLIADIHEDHRALVSAEKKYGKVQQPASIFSDFVQKIGFQMMVAYRFMRFLRALRLRLLAKIVSRIIRHLYGAEIHWDAALAPGVMVVHGVGLVLSHAARVGHGCILFQHVTLGESIHPETREIGAPLLESDVHIGPGATLLGPITIGRNTKIAAGVVLMASIPPYSLVEGAAASVKARISPRASLVDPVGLEALRAGAKP